jgi:LPXTG-motif cell wall-anchored protein
MLWETKTPNGYNLLDEPAKVTFADEDKTTHIVSKEIVNSKGFKLPNTGSLGMILLTVIGIILIGLAIVMFIPKKRRS